MYRFKSANESISNEIHAYQISDTICHFGLCVYTALSTISLISKLLCLSGVLCMWSANPLVEFGHNLLSKFVLVLINHWDLNDISILWSIFDIWSLARSQYYGQMDDMLTWDNFDMYFVLDYYHVTRIAEKTTCPE